MKYLHVMIRVHDLDATSRFFTEGLGLTETRRIDNEAGKFTLVYFGAPANPESINLNNSLRQQVDGALAAVRLLSTDRAERLTAVEARADALTGLKRV